MQTFYAHALYMKYLFQVDLEREKDKVHALEKNALQKDKEIDQCRVCLQCRFWNRMCNQHFNYNYFDMHIDYMLSSWDEVQVHGTSNIRLQ